MDASQVLNSRDRGSFPREFEEIIGNSPALERVLEQVKHVAPQIPLCSSRERQAQARSLSHAQFTAPALDAGALS